jgi:DNA (cytosine-5)-methyltransferase 1
MSKFTFGSLFSGIGGIDLGLQRAGFELKWQVEKDEFCQKVLAKHWANTPRYGDVRGLDAKTLAPVDLIAGGFPCQPHSLAGSRNASADERDLWGEFARIIRELRPVWVLAENVMGLLSSEDGDFFGKVLRDLATCGYDAQWFVLSAAQFGAPHLRERVFIVAHSASSGWQERACATINPNEFSSSGPLSNPYSFQQWVQQEQELGGKGSTITRDDGTKGDVEYSDRSGWQEQYSTTIAEEQRHNPWFTREPGIAREPQPGMGRDANGVSTWLDRYYWPAGPGQPQYQWEPPRVVADHVTDRAKRLKALGNAVVPQVAECIGLMIMSHVGADN